MSPIRFTGAFDLRPAAEKIESRRDRTLPQWGTPVCSSLAQMDDPRPGDTFTGIIRLRSEARLPE
jgi:hypothetical protein